MRRLFTGILMLLFSAFNLMAQYVNTDSLNFVFGFENPLTLQAFDSLQFVSPESEMVPGQFLFQSHVPSGKLLSEFSLPSNGKVISRFGPRNGRIHTGTDIKMNSGDTIFAAFFGTVIRAKYYYGYGNMVVVDHGNSLETSYAHLSGFLVDVGDFVLKGQPVGLAGRTGRATTNHLHFEIREASKPFDPELVFDFENATIREEVKETYNLTELHKELTTSGYASHEPLMQSYTVKPGDSLWTISRRFRTSVNSLCMLNGLQESSVLKVGMKLKLF